MILLESMNSNICDHGNIIDSTLILCSYLRSKKSKSLHRTNGIFTKLYMKRICCHGTTHEYDHSLYNEYGMCGIIGVHIAEAE